MSAGHGEQKIELEIYNMPFRLRAPEEEHDRLRRAARHVDSTMRELGGSVSVAETGRLAIQVALLISMEYFKLVEDVTAQSGLTDDIRNRVDNMIHKLDEELGSF